MPRIMCKARKAKPDGNWYQCNRTKGHDGDHADTHSPDLAYWPEPAE